MSLFDPAPKNFDEASQSIRSTTDACRRSTGHRVPVIWDTQGSDKIGEWKAAYSTGPMLGRWPGSVNAAWRFRM